MSSWTSYPKIYNVGHRAVADLFERDVYVEEKVDGSQFSFGKFDFGSGPELRCRSRGAQLNIEAPEGMFVRGVETAKALFGSLNEGWTYRGEYLNSPKHNTLVYDRVPKMNFILFDVNPGEEAYLSYEEKAAEAERLGLEVVPLVWTGRVSSADQFRAMLDTESILGGQKIEGVVCKPVEPLFGADGKTLMAKFVSEAFKEAHTGDWRERNPVSSDIVQSIIERYRTPARWAKAVQHLREAGVITDSPQDIGPLLNELWKDTVEECGGEMMSMLFSWASPKIKRGITAGMPEWYKEELVKLQFADRDSTATAV